MLEPRGQAVAFRHELARVVVEQELGPARATGDPSADPPRPGATRVRNRRVWCITPRPPVTTRRCWRMPRRPASGPPRSVPIPRPPRTIGRAIRVARDATPAERAALLQRCAIELYLINRPVQAIELQQQAVELTRAWR